jgi:hypothetical protein
MAYKNAPFGVRSSIKAQGNFYFKRAAQNVHLHYTDAFAIIINQYATLGER